MNRLFLRIILLNAVMLASRIVLAQDSEPPCPIRPCADAKPLAAKSTRLVSVVLITRFAAAGAKDDADLLTNSITSGFEAYKATLPAPEANALRLPDPIVLIIDPFTETWKTICQRLDNTLIDNATTVFFFAKLHGATKTTPHGPEHLLFLDMEDAAHTMERTALRNALAARGARLTVLVTDSCSRRLSTASLLAPEAGTKPAGGTVFGNLFFLPSGTIDINSSTYKADDGSILNEVAINLDTGGLFTGIFCRTLADPTLVGRLKLQDVPTSAGKWASVFAEVKSLTAAKYKAVRGSLGPGVDTIIGIDKQASQTPMIMFNSLAN